MDPSQAPPSISTAASGAAVDSSPSSSPKIRMMCSYGGHIVPRPTGKTLCYAGGDTRLVAIDRRSTLSLSTLTSYLSKSLLNGNPFCLKYQLPNHDLDSLISITTDEDLANMIDEYDRLISAASPSRLRFFLFPTRSAAAVDLHDPTSEDWFIDALTNAGVGGGGGSGSSLAESIVLEKNSSYGSTSSSASTSNSPAIRSGGGGGGGEEGVGVRLRDVKAVLPTVDSFASDSSLASPIFSPQAIVYQDAFGFVDSKVVSVNLVETESNASDHSPHTDLLSPVQVPGYILTKPIDQQPPQQQPPPQPQYIHPPPQSHYVTQYYPNPNPNPIPIPSYPTIYQPYVQPQPHVQYQINKPYPIYMTPIGQTQSAYDMSITDPRVPSNPVVVASPMVYDGYSKPAIPVPEYAAKVYRSPAVATQPLNVPSSDQHHQVAAFPPVNLMSQPVSATPTENTTYMCEYEDPMHAQIYKTQPPGPALPSQLQTATNTTTGMLSEAFTQLHVDKKH